MDRAQFLKGSLQAIGGAALGVALPATPATVQTAQAPDECDRVARAHQFTLDWITDLLDSAEAELDLATRERLLAGCGRACFRRHPFKRDIAEAGRGSVEKLIEAYHSSFEAWRAEDGVHIRFGETSPGCYCPAARTRPVRPGDLHCECSRNTHRAIFEAALGRDVRVDVLETVRRGGRTCHFVARV